MTNGIRWGIGVDGTAHLADNRIKWGMGEGTRVFITSGSQTFAYGYNALFHIEVEGELSLWEYNSIKHMTVPISTVHRIDLAMMGSKDPYILVLYQEPTNTINTTEYIWVGGRDHLARTIVRAMTIVKILGLWPLLQISKEGVK